MLMHMIMSKNSCCKNPDVTEQNNEGQCMLHTSPTMSMKMISSKASFVNQHLS